MGYPDHYLTRFDPYQNALAPSVDQELAAAQFHRIERLRIALLSAIEAASPSVCDYYNGVLSAVDGRSLTSVEIETLAMAEGV